MFVFDILDLLLSALKALSFLYWIIVVCFRALIIPLLLPYDWAAHRFDNRLPSPEQMVAKRWAQLKATGNLNRDSAHTKGSRRKKKRIE